MKYRMAWTVCKNVNGDGGDHGDGGDEVIGTTVREGGSNG